MKYNIVITGGFMAIPQAYQGEISLPGESMAQLVAALDLDPVGPPENEKLRDGLTYSLEIETGGIARARIFQENNLPDSIREFIRTIVKKESG